MPNTKHILITAAIALVAVAVAMRVPALGNVIFES